MVNIHKTKGELGVGQEHTRMLPSLGRHVKGIRYIQMYDTDMSCMTPHTHYHTFQMDGGVGITTDGSGANKILGACKGGPYEPGGRKSHKKQNYSGGMQVPLTYKK